MPIEALVSPFPIELTTPPVTKICLVIGRLWLCSKKELESPKNNLENLSLPAKSENDKGYLPVGQAFEPDVTGKDLEAPCNHRDGLAGLIDLASRNIEMGHQTQGLLGHGERVDPTRLELCEKVRRCAEFSIDLENHDIRIDFFR